MKTLKKILPLTALTAVGTIPVVATSCSNVYVDLFTKLYVPKFDPADKAELTSTEAIKLYKNRFVGHEGDAVDDFYWGSSIWCREVLENPDEGDKVLTYLNHIYDVKIVNQPDKIQPIISYKLKGQVQIKNTTSSGSYSIRSYDLYWEINNLEFWATHYNTITTDDKKEHQMWTLSPFKFDSQRGVWWKELTGNEQVKFDFKTVFKGYGVDGGQNYAWESAEAAIIDEQHKYVPELSEVYTAVMLFDSYYLSQISPKLDIKETWIPAKPNEGAKTMTNNLAFTFGDKTKDEGGSMELSIYKSIDVDKVEGSTLSVSKIDVGILPVTSGEQKVVNTIHYSGEPKTGDVIYYTIKADHKNKDTQKIDWTDYYFITTIVDKN